MLLDHLRRVTRDGRWVPEIDGLRFFAIFSVLIFHLGGEVEQRSGHILPLEPRFSWLWRLMGNGDRGVALFFVISGMILAMPFARQFLLGGRPVSLRKFYLRRLTRLEPPYLLAMLICAVLILVYQHGAHPGFFSEAAATMVYQHTLIYGTPSPLDMVTWSLEVEIQFYILAPLFMQLFRIRSAVPRRSIMLLLIAVLSVAGIPFHTYPRFYMSLLYYLQYFLTGLLVADIFVLDLERWSSSWAWDAAGLASIAVVLWADHEALWAHPVMPIFIAIICVAAMRSFGLRRFLSNSWVAVIGGMCYSIYLLHMIFFAAIFKLTRRLVVPAWSTPANLAVQLFVMVLPTLVLCALFFVLIERPCMDPDWPSRFWHALTGRPGQEAEALDAAGVSE